MWIALACLVAVVLVAAWMTRVNARYEAREAQARQSDDARVESVWESYGLVDAGGGADEAHEDPRVLALFDEVRPEALASKHAVISLAIMAARAGRTDLLGPLSTRAEGLDGGCGETAALGVLAAAHAGDLDEARARALRSQQSLSGCASCSASLRTKVLMQEVAIAMDALESEAAERERERRRDARETVDEAPSSAGLYVRRAG